MRNPEKAEAFAEHCDRWWLVISHPTIVKLGELPPTWGLMIATGRGITVKTQAPLRTEGEWKISRSFLAALLRSAARTHAVTPDEVSEAVTAALAQHKTAYEREREMLQARSQELYERIGTFEREAGVCLKGSSGESWERGHDPAKVGATLRAILDGDVEADRLLNRLGSIAEQAQRLADDARRAAGQIV